MNPTIKEVSAISLLSARNWNAQPREAMVSITGTGEPRVSLKKGWAYTLRLCFDDIEVAMPGRKLFLDDDADRVLDFLNKVEGRVNHVVVHCTHGLSRSPAIARFITIQYDLSNGFRDHLTFNRHTFETLFVRWKHRIAPGEGFCIPMGWARPDDPIYRMGPIVAGRPIFQPHRPSTEEEKAKNLQILREAAKGWRWVPVVPGTIPGMGEGKWFMPDGKEYTPRKRGE